MPELPDRRRNRFVTDFHLSDHVAQVLINNKEMADFFEAAVQIYYSPKEIANWLVSDLMSFIGDSKTEDSSIPLNLKIEPKHIADLARLVEENVISRHTAKSILSRIMRTGEMPYLIIRECDSSKIHDERNSLESRRGYIRIRKSQVIDASSNPGVVNFLLGKVLKLTQGRADPQIALALIKNRLRKTN